MAFSCKKCRNDSTKVLITTDTKDIALCDKHYKKYKDKNKWLGKTIVDSEDYDSWDGSPQSELL